MEFFKNKFKNEEFEDELEYINYRDSYISELNKCNIEEKTNGNLE